VPEKSSSSILKRALERTGGARSFIARTIIGVAVMWAIVTIFLPNRFAAQQNLVVLTTYFVLMSLGLNVMQGYTGLLNLGFGGFVCIGGYTYAILSTHPDIQMSFWFTLPMAFAVAALGGILIGIPTLRLSGDYFAIVTFGFSELVRLLANNWLSLTNAAYGLYPRAPEINIFGLHYKFAIFPLRPFVILGICLVILTVLFVYILSKSKWGRAWYALRDDPLAAQACGISQTRYRMLAFALSAGIGGVAGAFFISSQTYIQPEYFTLIDTSIMPLCMVVIGGEGSIVGVMAGAILLAPLGELLRSLIHWFNRQAVAIKYGISVPDFARFIFFGAVLVICMKFFPKGLFPMRVKKPRKLSWEEKTDEKPEELFAAAGEGEA